MVIRSRVKLLVLFLLGIFSSGDCEVCVANKSCILPCLFQAGQKVVIHWMYLGSTEEATIHSYFYDTDQLEHQDQDFRGRTQLFRQEIAAGNASLLLRGVRVKDKGKYKCYTSTSNRQVESFVNVQVEAPVGEIHIQQLGSQVSCRAEGIYPQPQLTWSTWPPFSLPPVLGPSIQETSEQLFTISSSLTLDQTVSTSQDVSYCCTVGTLSSSRTAKLSLTAALNSSSEATIHCRSSGLNLDLVWRFNHTEVILQNKSSSLVVSESWRRQVKEVSPSGNLALKDLEQRHSGFYTCSISSPDETNVTQTHLKVNISGDNSPAAGASIGVVVGVVVVVVFVIGFFCIRKRKQRKNPNSHEEEPMNYMM